MFNQILILFVITLFLGNCTSSQNYVLLKNQCDFSIKYSFIIGSYSVKEYCETCDTISDYELGRLNKYSKKLKAHAEVLVDSLSNMPIHFSNLYAGAIISKPTNSCLVVFNESGDCILKQKVKRRIFEKDKIITINIDCEDIHENSNLP